MSDQYAVVGNPIAHSKSPQIHAYFAKQTQQDLEYHKIFSENFKKTATDFFAKGGKGLNITVPFKGDAFRFADQCSERVKKTQAANTLKRLDNGQIFADNTDGIGLVQDLTVNHQYSLKDKRILMLGAGGAASGVLPSLIEAQPQKITIANRTIEKAINLAMIYPYMDMVGCGYNDLKQANFDLIINATSSGLSGDLPPIPVHLFKNCQFAYDMMYSLDADTVFVAWAKEQQVQHVLDGFGMLIEQAAAAFNLWRGIMPNTTNIKTQLF